MRFNVGWKTTKPLEKRRTARGEMRKGFAISPVMFPVIGGEEGNFHSSDF